MTAGFVVSLIANTYFLLGNMKSDDFARPIEIIDVGDIGSSSGVSLNKVNSSSYSTELLPILLELKTLAKSNESAIKNLMAEIQSTKRSGLVAASLSPEQQAEREARQIAKDKVMREKLMLDAPEDQRAQLMHQAWLLKNQDELWQDQEEMERILKVSEDWEKNPQ